MTTIWFDGSNVVINGSNEPIDCADCPCGGGVFVPGVCWCCDDSLVVARTLTATITDLGGCDCLDGIEVTLEFADGELPGSVLWRGTTDACEPDGEVRIDFVCTPGFGCEFFGVNVYCDNSYQSSQYVDTCDCDGFNWFGDEDFAATVGDCCGGTISVDITGAPASGGGAQCTACCTQSLPSTLQLTMTSGSCTCITGSDPIALTYGTYTDATPTAYDGWFANVACAGSTITLLVYCDSGTWRFRSFCDDNPGENLPDISPTCYPLDLNFGTAGGFSCGTCFTLMGDNYNVTE